MSLQNLLKIGQLVEHATDKKQVGKLLVAAARSLEDARQESISLETRLTAAYGAIMQFSMLALWVNNYRPSKSAAGHHQTMIQSLVQTIELDRDQMLLLDTFRVKRNAIDYTGDGVDAGSVSACLEATESLQGCLTRWMAKNKPELLP
ncbi:MAG: DNA-binding protein [Proteobacteria bacterium]|nr:DNA-binding protein [Pseudomonadota bacterium]